MVREKFILRGKEDKMSRNLNRFVNLVVEY